MTAFMHVYFRIYILSAMVRQCVVEVNKKSPPTTIVEFVSSSLPGRCADAIPRTSFHFCLMDICVVEQIFLVIKTVGVWEIMIHCGFEKFFLTLIFDLYIFYIE